MRGVVNAVFNITVMITQVNRNLDSRLQKLEVDRSAGQTRIIWTTVSDANGRLRDMTDAELDTEIARHRSRRPVGRVERRPDWAGRNGIDADTARHQA
jgi:hypothetical protein